MAKRYTQPQSGPATANPAWQVAHLWSPNIGGRMALRDCAGNGHGVFGAASSGTEPSGVRWMVGPTGQYLLADNTGTGSLASTDILIGDASGSAGPTGNKFTIACRIRSGGAAIQTIYSSASSDGVDFRLSGTNTLQLLKAGVALIGESTGSLTVGVDYDIAAVYDGATVFFYINGVLDSSVSSAQTFNHAQQYAIGVLNTERWVNGTRLYQLAVFNRVLFGFEAKALTGQGFWQLFAPTRTVFKASAAGGAALSGSNAASTSASASLTTAINLAASASAKTANSAGLTTSIALAGSNAATTVGLSALGTQIALAASNTAVTSATAALSTGITLQASNAATTSASATLAGSGTLQASNAATTGGSVALTTAITIAAAASASTSASAALATSVNVTATNSATTSSSAVLATAIQLVGQAAAAGSSSASLSTAIQLVASAAATTSASATLTVGSAPWSAAATASTMATVNLSTQIRLAATNAATTSASADLLIGTLVKDPRYIVSADARLFSLSASARPFGVAASARPFSVAISPRPWKVVAT